jgi:hypothetical protein
MDTQTEDRLVLKPNEYAINRVSLKKKHDLFTKKMLF